MKKPKPKPKKSMYTAPPNAGMGIKNSMDRIVVQADWEKPKRVKK